MENGGPIQDGVGRDGGSVCSHRFFDYLSVCSVSECMSERRGMTINLEGVTVCVEIEHLDKTDDSLSQLNGVVVDAVSAWNM